MSNLKQLREAQQTKTGKTGKPIRISIRYCDESELTIEERARMDAARKRLDAQISALLGKMIMEQQTRRQSWIS